MCHVFFFFWICLPSDHVFIQFISFSKMLFHVHGICHCFTTHCHHHARNAHEMLTGWHKPAFAGVSSRQHLMCIVSRGWIWILNYIDSATRHRNPYMHIRTLKWRNSNPDTMPIMYGLTKQSHTNNFNTYTHRELKCSRRLMLLVLWYSCFPHVDTWKLMPLFA